MKFFIWSTRVVLLLLFGSVGIRGQSPSAAPKAVPAQERRHGSLTLQDAMTRVLDQNPNLAVYDAEVRAQAARVLQAGLHPNPELFAEVENIAGTGKAGLVGAEETTIQIQQRFELGGKRSARVRAAEMERDLAAKTLLGEQAGLLASAAEAFIDILAAQQRLANRTQLFDLAQQIHATVTARVEAGKVSPIEESRSLVTLESARMDSEKASALLLAFKARLAAFWQGIPSDFEEAAAEFAISPRAEALIHQPDFAENPELQQARAAMEVRKAFLASEMVSRKPDIILSAGMRHLNEYGGLAWVAGVSIPLPLFDKRQGAIAEAESRVLKAAAEQRALENRLKSGLAQLRREGESAFHEARSLEEKILPAAHTALESLQEGYRQGKFDYLAVLDSERTYFELSGRRIDSVAAALKATVRYEYLTGGIMRSGAFSYINAARELPHE